MCSLTGGGSKSRQPVNLHYCLCPFDPPRSPHCSPEPADPVTPSFTTFRRGPFVGSHITQASFPLPAFPYALLSKNRTHTRQFYLC